MLLCVCASVRLCACLLGCLVAWLLGCLVAARDHIPSANQCTHRYVRSATGRCFCAGRAFVGCRTLSGVQTHKRANVQTSSQQPGKNTPLPRFRHTCRRLQEGQGGTRPQHQKPVLLAQLRWGLVLKRHEIIARSAARRFNRPHWLCSYSACALRFLLPAPRRIHAGRHPKKRRQP